MNVLLQSLFVKGEVVHGCAQARTTGFPTANLSFSEPLTIEEGIYCARTSVADVPESLPSVVFYGIPYAVPGITTPQFEVHFLDGDHELYGKELTVELTAFVRENKKFDDAENLQKAIEEDVMKVKKYFNILVTQNDSEEPR